MHRTTLFNYLECDVLTQYKGGNMDLIIDLRHFEKFTAPSMNNYEINAGDERS
jgi:hypothetical protein